MELVTDAHPGDPARDMALSQAMLTAVARRTGPETVRIYQPGATVAFGRIDQRRPGFPAAQRAARAHRRVPLVRLGGGHAAVYDRGCVVVELIRAQVGIVGGLEARYVDLVTLVQTGLARAGITLELGELAGEYCPGRYSLHLPAGPKVAGVAQRVVSGASLTTGVLVVEGGQALRATIADVYAALALPVDPDLAGALSDHHPDAGADAIAGQLLGAARERYGVR